MRDKRRNHEAGIALVLALLALMLLTFLGLALAATTSTELQIANNYRWGQQAFYNAEGGLDVAKHVLGEIEDWNTVLPVRSVTDWLADGSSPETFSPVNDRDYENGVCDQRGNGVGYGRILDNGIVYRDVHTVNDPDLVRPAPTSAAPEMRGAFTIWVRRLVVMHSLTQPPDDPQYTGRFTDAAGSETIVVTVEGVAPFTSSATGLLAEQHQAVRVIESTFRRDISGDVCDFMDPEGAGFAKCFPGPPGGDDDIR